MCFSWKLQVMRRLYPTGNPYDDAIAHQQVSWPPLTRARPVQWVPGYSCVKTARKAAEQPDGSRLKQDFLNLEKRWLDLARSFQLGEQLTEFTNEAKRNASA